MQSELLHSFETIEDLLAAAESSVADEDGDAEATADVRLNTPEFDFCFEQAIEPLIGNLNIIYIDELPEGETTGAALGGSYASWTTRSCRIREPPSCRV